jgi:hypothetical protein
MAIYRRMGMNVVWMLLSATSIASWLLVAIGDYYINEKNLFHIFNILEERHDRTSAPQLGTFSPQWQFRASVLPEVGGRVLIRADSRKQLPIHPWLSVVSPQEASLDTLIQCGILRGFIDRRSRLRRHDS